MDIFESQNYFAIKNSNYPQHECKIICSEKFSLRDRNSVRKQKQVEAWKRHQVRLQSLAAPKTRASKLFNTREINKISISKLLPRLKVLSQPKSITQKYVKRPETPFELPGKIKDWDRNWLNLRANPRRLKKVALNAIYECDEEYIEQ